MWQAQKADLHLADYITGGRELSLADGNWSRTDKLTALGIVVTVVGVIAAVLAIPGMPNLFRGGDGAVQAAAAAPPAVETIPALPATAPKPPAGQAIKPGNQTSPITALIDSMRLPANPKEAYEDGVAKMDAAIEACGTVTPELVDPVRSFFNAKIGLRLPELRSSSFYAERSPQWRAIFNSQVSSPPEMRRPACEGILSFRTLTLGI